MSRHEGVSCDNCLKNNFSGKRFKCLICYDYDLCESCHSLEVTTSQHSTSHAMQCILTRNEFGLYYGGENVSPESPSAFVCPFCAKLGFTEALLQEHVTKEHQDNHTEVVCPVCASLPSGDPNHVTEDLAHHLSIEHRASRDIDDALGGRHIRRRGIRTRNHRNMHFTSTPVGTSNIPSSAVVSNNNNTSTSVRDSMDPIAELLSQLSGVRRSAQQLQQNVTTASQLQELQAQLHLERQRAAEIRQQLERFPNKLHTGSTASQSANVHPSGGLVVTSKANASKKSSSIEDDDESTYLLSCLDDLNLSNEDKEKQNKEDVNRNMFVQELLLSMLSSENDEETKITPKPESDMERAVPVDCPLLASSPPRLLSAADSSADKLSMSTPKPSADSVDNEAPSIEKRKSTSNSESNNDTGMGSSIHTDNANSMAEFSVSSQEYNQRRLGDVSSHSDEACDRDRESSEWRSSPNPIASHYRDVSDDDEKDDNKPPSPTPTQQRLGLHLQSRVYSSGTVHLAGGVSSSAPIAGFGRDDVTSGNLNKHIH